MSTWQTRLSDWCSILDRGYGAEHKKPADDARAANKALKGVYSGVGWPQAEDFARAQNTT